MICSLEQNIKNYNSVMRQLSQYNLYNKNHEVICFAKDAILETK